MSGQGDERTHLTSGTLVLLLEYLVKKRAKSRIIKIVFCENDGEKQGVMGLLSKRARKSVQAILPECVLCTDYFRPKHVSLVLFELCNFYQNAKSRTPQRTDDMERSSNLIRKVHSELGTVGKIAYEGSHERLKGPIRKILAAGDGAA